MQLCGLLKHNQRGIAWEFSAPPESRKRSRAWKESGKKKNGQHNKKEVLLWKESHSSWTGLLLSVGIEEYMVYFKRGESTYKRGVVRFLARGSSLGKKKRGGRAVNLNCAAYKLKSTKGSLWF